MMPRFFHAARTALAVLALTLTTCRGMQQSTPVDLRRLADSPTSAPSLSTHPSVAPSSAPSLAPSEFPSPSPSTVPSLSPAPSTLSPTFPPVEMDKFDWDLDRFGAAQIRFSEEFAMGEIMLNYNISLRDFDIELFEENCTTPVPSSVATASGSVVQTSRKHGTLTVSVDIMKDMVIGSGIWTDGDLGVGYVDICVRVDLLLAEQGISVHFHEQILHITVNLLQGFQVDTVDVDRVDAGEEDAETDVQYELIACQCSGIAPYDCQYSTLNQGADVFICVKAVSEEVEVVGIESLVFSQGSYSVNSIVNGTADIFTAVSVVNKKAIIRNQMLSVFFEQELPDDVIAYGYALLAFTDDNGSTRLLRTRITPRVLVDAEDDAPFTLPLKVISSLGDGSSAAIHALEIAFAAMIGAAVLLAF